MLHPLRSFYRDINAGTLIKVGQNRAFRYVRSVENRLFHGIVAGVDYFRMAQAFCGINQLLCVEECAGVIF